MSERTVLRSQLWGSLYEEAMIKVISFSSGFINIRRVSIAIAITGGF